MRKIFTVMMLVGCMFVQLLPSASAQTSETGTYESDIVILDAYETVKDNLPEDLSGDAVAEGTSPNGRVVVRGGFDGDGGTITPCVGDARTTDHFQLYMYGSAEFYPNLEEGYYRVTINVPWANSSTASHSCSVNGNAGVRYYSGAEFLSAPKNVYVGTYYFKGDGTDNVKISRWYAQNYWNNLRVSYVAFEKVAYIDPYTALTNGEQTMIYGSYANTKFSMTKGEAIKSLGSLDIATASEADLYATDCGVIAEGSSADGDVMMVSGLAGLYYQQSSFPNDTDNLDLATVRDQNGVKHIEMTKFSKMYYMPKLEEGDYEIFINRPYVGGSMANSEYSFDGENWTQYFNGQGTNSNSEISIGTHHLKGDGTDCLILRAMGGAYWYSNMRYSYVTFRKVDCTLDAYKAIGALDTNYQTEAQSRDVTTDDGRIVIDFVENNGSWTFANRSNGGIDHYEVYNGSSITYYPNVEPGYYEVMINSPWREGAVAKHEYSFDGETWNVYQAQTASMTDYFSQDYTAGVHYFKGDGTDMIKLRVSSADKGRLSFVTLRKTDPAEFVAEEMTGSIDGTTATVNSYVYNGSYTITDGKVLAPSSKDYTLIIAAYKDENTLVDVKIVDENVARLTGEALSTTYELPADAKYVRAFLFDSVSGIKPFAGALELSK